MVLAGFALLVRFEPSVLRAVAMAVVATIAAASGRPAAGLRVLALAVTVLVLVDPLLVRSVGFGLSVSASAAILAIAPRLRVALHGPAWVVEPLAVTLAAQLGTLPLLVATFGGVPVASVPANLLAVPAAGPLMVWGITAGLVAGVVPPGAGWLLHLPTSALTSWLAWVASWAAALPLGEVGAPHGAVLALAALFVVALTAAAYPVPGRSRRCWRHRSSSPRSGVARSRTTGRTRWVRRRRSGRRAGATVLELQGPVDTRRLLADLRRTGARCVDVVAVGGGGRSAGVAAAALAAVLGGGRRPGRRGPSRLDGDRSRVGCRDRQPGRRRDAVRRPRRGKGAARYVPVDAGCRWPARAGRRRARPARRRGPRRHPGRAPA